MQGHTRYYYPDASVVCQPNPESDSFEDQPRAVFEVLSQGTRRIDEGEKKDAYLTIPSLAVYALVEQSTPAIVVFVGLVSAGSACTDPFTGFEFLFSSGVGHHRGQRRFQ